MSARPEQEELELPLLAEPSQGVPEVIDTPEGVQRAGEILAAAGGPLAVDAERASGFRYDQRAFLIQLRRGDSPILLIDPERLRLDAPGQGPVLASIAERVAEPEWILHAAQEDLASLAETGLRPRLLFDTERAARLLGYPRFGLAAVVGRTLGVRLAKEHSAVDWSTRPLPESWLSYAALDVEILAEVRDVLAAELEDLGRWEWAVQDFAHLRDVLPQRKPDPWRRVNGIGTIRSARELAIVKGLWEVRDGLARSLDLAAGKVLNDRVIVALATKNPQSAAETAKAAGRAMSMADAKRWYQAIRTARALPDSALPSKRPPGTQGKRRTPAQRQEIRDRTVLLKGVMADTAEELGITHDILLQPAIVRELGDTPPADLSLATIEEYLVSRAARPWQVELAAAPLLAALAE